jgi:hypothetical protein
MLAHWRLMGKYSVWFKKNSSVDENEWHLPCCKKRTQNKWLFVEHKINVYKTMLCFMDFCFCIKLKK